MLFPAAAETRQYALKSAPLRRVRFAEGDVVQSHAGEDFTVVSVEEANGLLVYKTDKRDLPEAELSDSISFSKPEDRLTAGQVDELGSYDLRIKGLQHRSRMRQSRCEATWVAGWISSRTRCLLLAKWAAVWCPACCWQMKWVWARPLRHCSSCTACT